MRSVAILVTALFLTACTAAQQDTAATAQTPAAVPTSPAATSAPPAQPADPAAPLPTATTAAATATEPPTTSAPDLAAVAVKLEPLVENLEQPLFVTHAGDGSGRQRVARPQVGQLSLPPFA